MSDDVKCPYVVGKTTLYCSLTPLTLTDAEREAIIVASIELNALAMFETNHAAALRGLLERTK